jgi:hypothetical protein
VPATAGRLPRRWRLGALAAFALSGCAGMPAPPCAAGVDATHVAAVEAAARRGVAPTAVVWVNPPRRRLC